MGVLDDAIREHLELKRRHGASDEEVAEKEEEALGAARGEATPESAPAPEGAGDDDLASDLFDVESAEKPPAEPPFAEEPFARESPPAEEPAFEDPPPAEPPVAEPPAEDEPFDPRDSDIVDQPTEVHPPPPPAETEVPWEEPEAGEAESEDVLEETPDFLQETPEHDRLWFEQKPPRDFDFDDEDK